MRVTDLNQMEYSKLKIPAFEAADISFYDWSPEHRPIKELSRHQIATASSKNKHHLLVLPSTTGRDIQILKHYQVPTSKASWLIIERNIEYFHQFKENSLRLQLFSNRETIEYHPASFNTYLSKQTDPFDFAWFDLVGNLTYTDLFWLRDTFKFTNSADLFFTFAFRARTARDNLINNLKKFIQDIGPKGLARKLGVEDYYLNDFRQLRAGENRKIISRSKAMDLAIIAHWQLFKYAFPYKTFDLHCYVYHDIPESGENPQEMLLYHLSNFQDTDQPYPGIAALDKLIEMRNLWRNVTSDADIAEDVKMATADISRWRAINRLPSQGYVTEYKMADGFMNLLAATEVDPPAAKKHASILLEELDKFNPFISKYCKVQQILHGIKVVTPRRAYQILVDEEFGYQPSTNISIPPIFLHPFNVTALHAIFRVLFVGNEFTHPQLCEAVDPNCLFLSPPQVAVLKAWEQSIRTKEHAGVVVLPTGTGKTLVASQIADTIKNCKPSRHNTCRVLFLAHQQELLDQSIKTFLDNTFYRLTDVGLVYRTNQFKQYQGMKTREEHLKSKVVFATIQTLSDERIFLDLPDNHFSLIIVDEFHHYQAKTWSPVLEHFSKGCQYILGLSATPFRSDEYDPMDIFQHNFLYRMDLNRAIWSGYLTWPDYYLFDDKTDYSKIFSQKKLTKARIQKLDIPSRNRLILEKFIEHARDKQTIGFCRSKQHAEQMAAIFQDPSQVQLNARGFKAEFIHSGDTEKVRHQKINAFQRGEIQILFTVDLFNEGVNIPEVEAILFLRKTVSPIKVIQQLGRGLRLAVGKTKVTVLDFMGNYDDLDSIFNLGLTTNINVGKVSQCTGSTKVIAEEAEELPIIPHINFKLGKGVKFIIKNLIDEATVRLEKAKRQQAMMLRNNYQLWDIDIAKKLDVSLGKVRNWLSDIPIPETKTNLIRAVKELAAFGLADQEIADDLELSLKEVKKYKEA